MAKQRIQEKRPQEKRPAAGESSAYLVIVGVVCLAIGLGIGYYFGQQSSPAAAPVSAAQTNMPIANPAAFAQTEASLKATLAANAKDLNALVQLGNLYYDNGRFKEAIDYYGRALDIDPKNPDVRTDRGTSYWNLGQADAAITEFKKALDADPTHAQTLYNLGVVYLNGKNNAAEARKTWETLLAKNPNYPDRAKVLDQLSALSAPGGGASSTAGQGGGNAAGMEDLLQRMKTNR